MQVTHGSGKAGSISRTTHGGLQAACKLRPTPVWLRGTARNGAQ